MQNHGQSHNMNIQFEYLCLKKDEILGKSKCHEK